MTDSSRAPRTPLSAEALGAVLRRERLVPVLRTASEEELQSHVSLALEAGLGLLEITTTSPGWAAVLSRVRSDPEYEQMVIGAGTVTSADQVEVAPAAGAQFLVSPYLAPEARVAAAGRIALVEGGMTPAEIAAASEATGLAKGVPRLVGRAGLPPRARRRPSRAWLHADRWRHRRVRGRVARGGGNRRGHGRFPDALARPGDPRPPSVPPERRAECLIPSPSVQRTAPSWRR